MVKNYSINKKEFIMFKILGFIVSVLLCAFPASAKIKIEKHQLPTINYVSIPVQTPEISWVVSAKLSIPRTDNTAKMPAVVIMHSSGGIDSTGDFYAKSLNKNGIVTIELDLWGARNLAGGTDRPASPQETLPDAIAALHYLASRPDIEPTKIGIIGFSWGGVLSMLTATEQYMSMTGSSLRYAAHVAHYPVCWVYNNVPGFEFEKLTGAPVLIQTGQYDDYDLPDTCSNMVNNLADTDKELTDLNIYNRAYHAWDRLEPTLIIEDPFAHLGQGGIVTLKPNKRLAAKSRRKAVRFFNKAFNTD
ncbi:MAG: dienelactone hydrolase [Colwellia sp.]